MTITKSGELTSFYTVNKAPIKHLRVYFSPKQAGSGTASPENVREISGWNNLDIIHTNKSLFNFKKTTMSIVSDYNGNYGWFDNLSVNYIPKQPITYSVYIDATNSKSNGNSVQTWIMKKNGSYRYATGNTIVAGTAGWSTAQMTITDNDDRVAFGITAKAGTIVSNPIVKLSSTASDYEPYKGSLQTIDWSNDIGTIYGGYVDLITGELVEEYIKRQVTEFTGVFGECKNGYCAYVYDAAYDHTVSKLNQSYMKCNYFEYSPYGRGAAGGTSNGMPLYTYGGDNGDLGTHGFILPNTITSLTEANAWLNNLSTPLECIIRLKNPNTYTLTPQQLETFLGRNNIWSNADHIEVEYDLAESNDELYRRRNILLQGAPHLETATGNVANFKTDLIAPIKEAKVYFEPKQLGSGDPSPSNVREIVGYTSLEIKHTGGNLIDPTIAGSTQEVEDGIQTNITPNADGTITVAGRDGTSWQRRGKIDLPAGTYRLYSEFGSGFHSRYEINDIAEEINFIGYKNLTLAEPSYLRFKAAMGTTYPATGWLQLLYEGNEYDPRPYIEEKINVTFPTVGKNLLDITRAEKINPGASTSNITISDGTISIDAVASSARSYVLFAQEFPAGTYTIQIQNSGAVGNPRLLTTSEISNSSYNTYYTLYSRQMTSGSLTFTLTQTSKIGLVLSNVPNESGNPGSLYNIQLESGSTVTTYEPYTNTIYGGYIDLTNGEIVQTHFLFQRRVGDMDNNESYPGWKNCSDFKAIANYIDKTDNGYGYNLICNVGDRIWYNSKGTNPTVFIYLEMKNNMTQTEWKTNYPDLVMKWVLPLAVPIHYPLTPQTLKTLKGTNNIWSSANGPVSIKYWTH